MFEQLATSEALLATAEANLIASHSSQLPEFLINFSNFMYSNPVAANLITIIFYLWIAVWKCLALWKAAQLKQKGWFIGLFVINSLGILEIAYLFFFSKQDWHKIAQNLGLAKKSTVKEKTAIKKSR